MNNAKLPPFLIQKLEKQYGKEVTSNIIQGYQAKRKTTFRVNNLKAKTSEVLEILEKDNISYKTVTWSKEAFIIENVTEKEIRNLSIYQEGKIYLQRLSSMLPLLVLEPKEGNDILDMAAAPGGKTTQIAAITNNKANITACEMNKIRAERLKYNLAKQGAKVYVMLQDARNIDDFFSFDQILLDAPCSGSGTILLAKNEEKELEKNFTNERIQKIAKTQKTLLKKAIRLLKPGKEMIYSTCSILASENEEVIQEIQKEENIEIVPINLKGIEEIPLLPTKIPEVLCVAPTQLYEGFFIAKIRKNAHSGTGTK